MDFNAFVYYKQTNQRTERLPREEVWDIILHPNKKFEAGVVYKMKPSNAVGPLIPAHFPSLSDSLPLHKAFKALFAWHISNDLPQTLDTLVPPYLMHLIDPKPMQNLEHEPYFINSETETLKVCMATFSDAIQIVKLPNFHNVLHLQVFKHIVDVIPAHHSLVLDPFSNNYIPEIGLLSSVPPGTILACWNVRDAGRMSFHSNFRDLFEIYKPALVVLFETRNSVHNLSEIVPRLPGNYTFSHSIMDSHSGGVALLWRWKVLYCQARFQGQGHQPSLDVVVKVMRQLLYLDYTMLRVHDLIHFHITTIMNYIFTGLLRVMQDGDRWSEFPPRLIWCGAVVWRCAGAPVVPMLGCFMLISQLNFTNYLEISFNVGCN